MPIQIPNDLPATGILQNENIFVMREDRAISQDIRPLEIVLLNLMPTKIVTETQLSRLLGNTPLQVHLELMHMSTHTSKNVSQEHLLTFYKRFDELGMQGLNDKMHEHYLTSLLADYMPRLRPGQRVFLINGEGNNLDFASVNSVELAGDNGKWVITPIDNETQVYAPTERLNPYEVSDTELKYYTALYLDFPVKAKDTANTKFFTLSEEKTATVTGETLSYTELVAIDGEVIAAHTPFIVESAQKDATLVIPNEYVFTALTPMPDNAVIVGEDETVTQHAPARVDEAQPAATRELRGVLLPTAATPEALKNYWNLDEAKPAYTYDAAITHGSDVQTGFRKAEGTINANEALYVPDTDRNYNMVLIGEPKPYIITGIEGVGADGEADEVLYDLNGRRVSEPVPGQIYVLKGRKIIAH